MATRKYKFKHIAASASTHVGDAGELILDTINKTLKISDGATSGGTALAGKDVSVIRAQRTAGGNSSEVNRYTITHISGNVTLSIVYTSNVEFRFKLNGYTALPSALMSMEVAYSPTGPTDRLASAIGTLGSRRNSPNVFSAFDPDTHYLVGLTDNTTQAVDFYFLIKE